MMSPGSSSAVAIGLVGAGGFGHFHFQALRQLEREGLVRLLAVADPDLHRFPELIAECKANKIRIYCDHREMLCHEPSLKAVSLATPIPYHYEMVRACIEHGLFVYLEKPPVPLFAQLQELIEADKTCRVVVGFQMINTVWSQKIKDYIEKGKLGDVVEIRACACWPRPSSYYRRAGWAGTMTYGGRPVFDGPATNALAHLIHNIMFFGACRNERFGRPTQIQGEIYRARPIEGYDTACLRGLFGSGTAFFAALTHATQEALPFQMEVVGTRGWMRIKRDGKILESSHESIELFEPPDILILKALWSFVSYVNGETIRPDNLLKDVEGYVLATNGLLLSSLKVHDIPPSHVRCHGEGGKKIHSVIGLHKAIGDAVQTPRLFSESDLPWAVKTEPVPTAKWCHAKGIIVEKLLKNATGSLNPRRGRMEPAL